jgi:hypothetical protein
MEERLTVVPDQASARGGTSVIVTDNAGNRFRLSESGKNVTLEQDTTPSAEAPTWQAVNCAQATLPSTLAAMVDVLKS